MSVEYLQAISIRRHAERVRSRRDNVHLQGLKGLACVSWSDPLLLYYFICLSGRAAWFRIVLAGTIFLGQNPTDPEKMGGKLASHDPTSPQER
jgi:hypothetical protein